MIILHYSMLNIHKVSVLGSENIPFCEVGWWPTSSSLLGQFISMQGAGAGVLYQSLKAWWLVRSVGSAEGRVNGQSEMVKKY
jgi:hypothetical protein